MHKSQHIDKSGQAGAEVTPEMVEEGVRLFREWEDAALPGDGSPAFCQEAERLVVSLLNVKATLAHKVG